MTYRSEVHHLPGTVGDTQTGITICYGGCNGDPRVLLATITYMQYGTSENCSQLLVLPHPDAETVEETDCNFLPMPAYVHDFTLSAPACGCSPIVVLPGAARAFGCGPLGVEQSTWGKIKALYR